MSNHYWKVAIDGDWQSPGLWFGGVPTAADDAFLDATGGDYTVTISTSAAANALTIDDGATLSDFAGATLSTGELDVNGNAILDGSNAIGSMYLYDGGLLSAAGDDALGSARPYFRGGELLATGDIDETTVVDWETGTAAAAHGKTLRIDGFFILAPAGEMTFGDGANDGTVVLSGNGSSTPPQISSVSVHAGTLTTDSYLLGLVLGIANVTTIDAGATIDVAGHSATIKELLGEGAITNSGAATTLTLAGGGFFGRCPATST